LPADWPYFRFFFIAVGCVGADTVTEAASPVAGAGAAARLIFFPVLLSDITTSVVLWQVSGRGLCGATYRHWGVREWV
jgi:hypothetical protein